MNFMILMICISGANAITALNSPENKQFSSVVPGNLSFFNVVKITNSRNF